MVVSLRKDAHKPRNIKGGVTPSRGMGYKTIRAGQKALIFNELGEGRVVKGPRRVRQEITLFRAYASSRRPKIWLQRTETFQLLKVHIASQAQYLEVRDKEGRVTNHSG